MAQTTRFFGLALIALGIVGYVATDAVSITALIPAFFGVVLVILGWLARNERHRKHAMHVAAIVGLLGLLGAVRGLSGLFAMLSGGEVQRPAAAVSQSIMAILMGIFVGLCVRSFIEARRTRIAKG